MVFDRTLGMVGTTGRYSGDITKLNAIGGPRPPADIERMLGYRSGRLARGYYLLLLTQPLGVDDFDFAGTTLRSGGREGLPAATINADSTRRHVSDRMRQEQGDLEYLRKSASSSTVSNSRAPNGWPRSFRSRDTATTSLRRSNIRWAAAACSGLSATGPRYS